MSAEVSAPLVQQVQEALAAIPHGGDCASRIMAFGSPEPVMACDCDREQWIAQRVAAAIEAATRSEQDTLQEARKLALRALRGDTL